ncbi:hypothetical protein AY601_2153 [Pedobacter cryoconitis]|uniref:Uncharacterized protein n=1 Tax=Pedobacter cryoconitis TaxID=188932 RepID=A0A127VCM5_9SPHI|nr:hypothetical protein [Pedobacter cryoconitis]AMP99054.1 hypothetical protein AY601_2153 [Pedobacter cryoconitis]
MNKFFKNVNTFGLTVVVIAGGLIFTQSAFKSANPNRFDTSYFFNGADNTMLKNPAKWSTQLDDEFVCAGQTKTPCELIVPAGQTLDSYLFNHTPQQINNAAVKRRSIKL